MSKTIISMACLSLQNAKRSLLLAVAVVTMALGCLVLTPSRAKAFYLPAWPLVYPNPIHNVEVVPYYPATNYRPAPYYWSQWNAPRNPYSRCPGLPRLLPHAVEHRHLRSCSLRIRVHRLLRPILSVKQRWYRSGSSGGSGGLNLASRAPGEPAPRKGPGELPVGLGEAIHNPAPDGGR